MKAQNRTYEPKRFRKLISAFQLLLCVLLITLWTVLGLPAVYREIITDTGAFVIKAVILAAAFYAVSALREGIRYLCFMKAEAVKREYLTFGFSIASGGGFYTKCMAAIGRNEYYLAQILPDAIIGWLPLILSFVLGRFWMFACASFLTADSLFRILILIKLGKLPKGSWVQESPFQPGCDVYLPEDPERDEEN